MKLCPNCNKLYESEESSVNFCPYCGKNYSQDNNFYKTCNNCKEKILVLENEESNFCPYCGKKYDESNNQANEIDSFELDHYENKKKYILGIVLYFAFFYVASVIVSVVISFIWMGINNLTSIDIDSPLYNKYMSDVLAWSNFTIYIIALGTLLPFSIKFLIKDLKDFKKNPGINFKWFGFGVLIMYGGIYASAIIVEILSFNLETGDSANQEIIVSLLKSGGINMFLMTIMTVIFAPILEEIVFRKYLFGLFKKNTMKTVILSAIIFAGIHTIPTCIEMIPSLFTGDAKFTDLYLEFIYIFQYIGQAFALAFVYHKTKGNIIPCIMIHFLNNFISILGTLLFY